MNDASARLLEIVHELERADQLDAVDRAVTPVVKRVTRDDATKRVLSGAPLGHRLHPLLTDIPIGCWTAASLLDVCAWRSGERSSRRLVAFGIAAAVPTALTGLSDWDDTYGGPRRIGLVHAAANTTALLLQVQSWRARRRGRHIRGALYGLAGLGAVTIGGYLGGHLVYSAHVGVDVDVSTISDATWHTACRFDELQPGKPIRVTVDNAAVAIVLVREHVYAIAATCSHAGGPLDEGTIRDDAIVCPWHGSTFCLADGSVERGPATHAQPVYETRKRGDVVEVRATTGTIPLVHAVV